MYLEDQVMSVKLSLSAAISDVFELKLLQVQIDKMLPVTLL